MSGPPAPSIPGLPPAHGHALPVRAGTRAMHRHHGASRHARRSPFTSTVLITQVPYFARSIFSLRQWLLPCGTIRSVNCFPRAKELNDDDKAKNEARRYTLLITFSHQDAAVRLVASFRAFLDRIDPKYRRMAVHMVPANPNMLLPPPNVDKALQKTTGDKLHAAFTSLAGHSASASAVTSKASSASGPDKADAAALATTKLDTTKTAAAAGGSSAYDVDEDPLNAPEVLQAVQTFRRNLDRAQTSQQKLRIRLVQEKMAKMKSVVKERMQQELKEGKAPKPLPKALPPPPPPSASVPLPTLAKDSGKRKHSNLPAWMTQQPAAGAESAPKKAKTDVPSMADATNFPVLPAAAHDDLSTYLTQQIQEVLGEAEDTLITFIHGHVTQGKPIKELEEELKEVLDEDAPAFLQQLWSKVQGLAK